MNILDKLKSIDRRIIFVLIALTVILPILHPIGLPVRVSEPVRKLYEAIEALPPGSRVLISLDYDPATFPEVYPMNLAVVRHCFAKDLKVVAMALWPMGPSLGEMAFDVAAKEYNKEYGKDYVNLGYKIGGIVVIAQVAKALREAFPLDQLGTPIDSLPIMDGVTGFKDFKFIVDFSAGDPGIPYWVMIASSRYHMPLGAGCTAVSAPNFYPYLAAGQLVGLLGGMKGAAEYEKLVKASGLATSGMDAQSIAHAVIVFFIVFGNVIYFMTRRRRP
ncbi:MAG TPA: hypothetical protein EYP60_03810 [bacterium (Candidatus Stahlbacteria)]|nr:hypothetical protein [Candidatus Stahlbacteria bacterium]